MRLLLLLVAGVLALFAGCRASQPPHSHAPLVVEVLGFPGCPHTAEFLERVRGAARRVEGARVLYVDQQSLPASDMRRGYPAPTALVNGNDLFGLPRPGTPAMGCRVYEDGLPSSERIAERLRTLASR